MPRITSRDVHDVIVVSRSYLRHALLRRLIRARGNYYVLNLMSPREVTPWLP